VPYGQKVEASGVDKLKYQEPAVPSETAMSKEMLTVKLRYKEPNGDESRLISVGIADANGSIDNASENLKFSAAVAAFGMLLRDSKYKGDATYDRVIQLARASTGADLRGYRAEFIQLAEKAKTLAPRNVARN
jgi:Ca-activated chloride channel family protein